MIGHDSADHGTSLLCDNRESGEFPWANYFNQHTFWSFWLLDF
jgi:hypothetical protein